MFPLVHIYAATEVSKRKTPLLVIGSVIPDLVWLNRDKFSPEKLHDNLDDFYSYVERESKEMLDLALGMKLHSNQVGADKYSHFYKGGYCYIKGKEIIPDLIKLIKTKERKKISDLSHNFIEASLDLLLKNRLGIIDLYRNSLSQVNLTEISSELSKYSKIEKNLISKALETLLDLVKSDNLASEESIANNVLPQMIELGFNQKVDNKKVLKILQKSVEISGKDYDDLFKIMITTMRKDFHEFS